MKYDLHIHSNYSRDGIVNIKDIVKTALKRNLSGIAITDHNAIKGALEAKKYETKDFKVVVGSEISTERGDVIGLFLSKEIKSNKFHNAISEIREQNGIIIIPHPFDEARLACHPTKDDINIINGVEVFNSRCLSQKYNAKAAKFAEKHKLTVTAGSDAHFKHEIGRAGIITESEDLYEAILENETNIFGEHSSIINYFGTKIVKLLNKITH